MNEKDTNMIRHEEFIRKNYKTMSDGTMAHTLGIAVVTVRHKRRTLGLKKTRKQWQALQRKGIDELYA